MLTFLMSTEWMPVLNSSMITVLPIFLPTSYVLSHHSYQRITTLYLMIMTICKTAIGAKMAPCLASIFMEFIEQKFTDNSPLTPLFYVRFIDDIIMIMTHGSEELEQFSTRSNSTHPSMKFTTEISSTSSAFPPYTCLCHC